VISPALFSSATDDWATPQELFDQLNGEFLFALDVCATPENAKCALFYTREQDGLKQDWARDARRAVRPVTVYGIGERAIWMNPPYGRGIGEWVAKAWRESTNGVPVVCLLPARTCTRWWHDFIWDSDAHTPYPGVQIRFVEGRLKFGGSKNSAPFPSVIVVFRGGP
jgi:phage N-6-adenine-methyltransferase